MSSGAFRDASAAIERAAVLEDENRALQQELVTLRGEMETLRTQLAEALQGPENADAYVKRVQEERDELLREVKDLREGIGGAAPIGRLKAQIAALTAERDTARDDLERQSNVARNLELRLAEEPVAAPPVPAPAPPLPDNRDAYVQRVQEERDELLREVRELREAAARRR